MTTADSQSSDNWFTTTKLKVPLSNCLGNDHYATALNSIHLETESLKTKRKHFFVQHTTSQKRKTEQPFP